MGKVRKRDKWMLFLLSSIYMVGELGHFLIGVVSRSVAQDLHYGDKGCLPKPNSIVTAKFCDDANSSHTCELIAGPTELGCVWDYNGLGIEYQYLAGPSYIVAFTIAGVIWGIAADSFNRVTLLSIGTLLFSIGITATAFATKYWHLILLRALLAIGEAACAPLAAGMISDVFPREQRALAMGIFNWGIYIGYGFSYAVGNYVTDANIMDYGWRPSFFISGIPGIAIAVLFFFTVKDPSLKRKSIDAIAFETKDNKYILNADPLNTSKAKQVVDSSKPGQEEVIEDISLTPLAQLEENYWVAWKSCLSPVVLVLVIAACIRHTAGFTWGYNSALYFQQYYPDYDAGWWLTCISIFGGAAGAVIGGYIADKLVTRLGISARALVLAGSQLLATPFTIGLLYLDPPLAFFSLLVGYLVAEMWFGVMFAIMVELVPLRLRSTAIGIALFVINNAGGNLPVFVAPISNATSLRTAVTILYPGALFTSSLLFFSCWFFLRGRK